MTTKKKVYPDKTIAFNDFSGGWNADTSPDTLANNECEKFDNVDTSIVNAIKQRAGVVPLNNTAYGGNIFFLYEWSLKDGSKIYLGLRDYASGNSCDFGYFDVGNNWAFKLITTFTAHDVGFLPFNDKFYITGETYATSSTFLFISNHGMAVGDLVKNQTLVDKGGSITDCVRSISSITEPSFKSDAILLSSSITNQSKGDIIKLYSKMANITAEVDTCNDYIVITGHGLSVGDFIRNTTRGGGFVEVTSVSGSKLYLGDKSIANQRRDTIERYKFSKKRITQGERDLFVYDGTTISSVVPYGGAKQVETATVAGTVTGAGNAVVVVTSHGTDITVPVAVLLGDTAGTIANKIGAALLNNDIIRGRYDIDNKTGTDVTLTSKIAADNDTTLNISIANGTCTGIIAAPTSTNTTAGVAQGSGVDMEPIRRCRCFAWNPKNGRIFATRDYDDVSCLYYSEANDPTYFKATSKVYPTQGEGEAIGITPFSTGIIMEFNNALWSWTGYDPADDAEWGRLPLAHGCIAHGSVCHTPNSLTMVGIGGLYALSPGVMDKDLMMINAAQMSVNLSSGRVSSVIENASHKSTMISCYQITKQRYLLAYGDDPSNPKNNRILSYDFARNSFSRFTGIQADYFCPCDNGDVLIASGAYILKMEQGLNDFDISTGQAKAVKLEVESKAWDFGYPYIKKSLKKMLVSCYQYINSDCIIDIGIKGGYKSILFPDVPMNESLTWGDDWGDIWGWTTEMTREFRTRIKSNRFQLVITHEELNEDLLIYGVAFKFKVTQMKGVKYSGTSQKDVLS